MKNKRTTLQDIARQAGTTKMTVSRYLRDKSKVSKGLQISISEAIDTLGYIPNKAPDILSKSISHAVGILVPSLSNQVFAEVVNGIEDVLEPAGYQPMLAHYGYSQEIEEARIKTLLSYNVDALVLSESKHTKQVDKMLEMSGIPIVEIMDSVSPTSNQAVGIDNEAGSYAMTSMMIEKKNRKHIVYLAARMDNRTQLKINGYEKAMLDHNLKPSVFSTGEPSSFTTGGKLLVQAFKENAKVDGVFCTNDDLAIGAFYESQKLGLKVPQDISIAGFHGHDMSKAMHPRLATVSTPRKQIGIKAAEIIIARLKEEELADDAVIHFPFKLEEGQTL